MNEIYVSGRSIANAQVSDRKRSIPYRPEYNIITGSVEGSILIQQIWYWWKNNNHKPFYKYRSPCKAKRYKKGDSWLEELGFTGYAFDKAIDSIGTKVTTGTGKANVRNNSLVIYWTDSNRTTWYELNESLFFVLVGLAYENPQKLAGFDPSNPLANSYVREYLDSGDDNNYPSSETTPQTTSIPIDGVPSIAPGGETPFSGPWEKPPEAAVITKPPKKVPVKKKRRRDPRLDHPAIRAVKEAKDTVRNPPKGTWDVLIKTIGDNPDVVKLKQCWTEWCVRGYNTASYKWVTDWYVGGIKGKMTKQENAGNWRLEW